MTVENIILGFIVLMFATFIVCLGGVALWTEWKPKATRRTSVNADSTPWYGQDGDNEYAD